MVTYQILFYLISSLMVVSAGAILVSRNTIISLLFLIFMFFNVAALFLLQGAEFVAMVMVIVYVGAVAILFLFVIMMINPEGTSEEPRKRRLKYVILCAILAAIVLFEFLLIIYNTSFPVNEVSDLVNNEVTNTELIGTLLYTKYALQFIVLGVLLLVAMIGAILLTLRHRKNIKRQQSNKQLNIKPSDVVKIISGDNNVK